MKTVHKDISVSANDDYSLDLTFNDDSVRRFDVNPYLKFGVFQELKDQSYFKRVKVVFGTVQWPHEQDISPDTLYMESRVIESA